LPRPSGYKQPGNWASLRARVLARDGSTCTTCGQPAYTADHVTPVAQGGSHDMSNLAAICKPCHDAKTKAEARAGWTKKRSRKRPPEQHPGLRKK